MTRGQKLKLRAHVGFLCEKRAQKLITSIFSRQRERRCLPFSSDGEGGAADREAAAL